MEVYGTEKYQALDTQTCQLNQFIVGLGLFMGLVGRKENIEYHQYLCRS